jgi:hypothetical protein
VHGRQHEDRNEHRDDDAELSTAERLGMSRSSGRETAERRRGKQHGGDGHDPLRPG